MVASENSRSEAPRTAWPFTVRGHGRRSGDPTSCPPTSRKGAGHPAPCWPELAKSLRFCPVTARPPNSEEMSVRACYAITHPRASGKLVSLHKLQRESVLAKKKAARAPAFYWWPLTRQLPGAPHRAGPRGVLESPSPALVLQDSWMSPGLHAPGTDTDLSYQRLEATSPTRLVSPTWSPPAVWTLTVIKQSEWESGKHGRCVPWQRAKASHPPHGPSQPKTL